MSNDDPLDEVCNAALANAQGYGNHVNSQKAIDTNEGGHIITHGLLGAILVEMREARKDRRGRENS